jgi:hypothetical protein
MNYRLLLETYTLEEVLELLDLEPIGLLELLSELGYDFSDIVEPLDDLDA